MKQLIALAVLVLLISCASERPFSVNDVGLSTFSEKSFQSYLKFVHNRQKKLKTASLGSDCDNCLEEVIVTASFQANPEITNNQVSGVDEGGIVKVVGDFIVVLHDDQLHSISIKDENIEWVASINLTLAGRADDTWFDEILVDGQDIALLGYSYGALNASQISHFNLNNKGQFEHISTQFLRSSDYYSDENSSARLLNGRLMIHLQQPIDSTIGNNSLIPSFIVYPTGKSLNNLSLKDWQPLVSVDDIVQPKQDYFEPVMHTVLSCELGQALSACRIQSFVGGQESASFVSKSSFYISHTGVNDMFYRYLTTNPDSYYFATREFVSNQLYRIDAEKWNLDAVSLEGIVNSSFSFNERGDELVVLTHPTEVGGRSRNRLYTIPESDFQNGQQSPNATEIWLEGNQAADLIRFVDGYLFLADSSAYSGGQPSGGSLYMFDLETAALQRYQLENELDGIERIGHQLLAYGWVKDGATSLTTIDPRDTSISAPLLLKNRGPAESRSHSFATMPTSGNEQYIAFPTTKTTSWNDEYPIDMTFLLHSESKNLELLQHVELQPTKAENCQASCEDWYGNARAFQIQGRTFALIENSVIELSIDKNLVQVLQELKLK